MANRGLVGAQLLAHDGDDRFQDGLVGLMVAVDRYDPTVGVRFATFATRHVREAVSRGREQRRLWRVPRDTLSEWSAIERELDTQLAGGESPDVHAAAERCGAGPAATFSYVEDRQAVSLQAQPAPACDDVADRVVADAAVDHVRDLVDDELARLVELRRRLSRAETAEVLGVDVATVAAGEAQVVAAVWHPTSGVDVQARGGSEHGRRATYVDGCRCGPCRSADRAYKQALALGADRTADRAVPLVGLPRGRRATWVTFDDATRHPTPGAWRSDGVCAGRQADVDDAVSLGCGGCPVRRECGEYGLSVPGLPGVWGGMGQVERVDRYAGRVTGAAATGS